MLRLPRQGNPRLADSVHARESCAHAGTVEFSQRLGARGIRRKAHGRALDTGRAHA